MDTLEILKECGLSNNEAKIYLALLESGTATATDIAKKTRLHRTNVYDSLKRMIEKGMAAHFQKDNTTCYEATNPEGLLNLMKQKEAILQSVLPQLKLARNLAKGKTEARVFEGKQAIVEFLFDLLNCNDEILVYGIPKEVPDMLKTILPHFHKERVTKKVWMKHIYNHDARERINYLNSLPYTEARYLPEPFDSQVSTFVCGNEVVFTLWIDNMVTIRIENKLMADAYRKYFNLLYGKARK